MKMNKKRTKLEVIRDVLNVLKEHGNVKITHLIYKSNLSYVIIKEYIKELTERGMMKPIKQEEKSFYTITPRGLQFLKEFEKIKIFTEAYGLESGLREEKL